MQVTEESVVFFISGELNGVLVVCEQTIMTICEVSERATLEA